MNDDFPYCVYITFSKAPNLPLFYIGYSSCYRIQNEGYQGSVSSKKYKKIWNDTRKQNPELFETFILKTFARVKEAIAAEIALHNLYDVAVCPLFFNQAKSHSTKFSRRGMKTSPETSRKRIARQYLRLSMSRQEWIDYKVSEKDNQKAAKENLKKSKLEEERLIRQQKKKNRDMIKTARIKQLELEDELACVKADFRRDFSKFFGIKLKVEKFNDWKINF